MSQKHSWQSCPTEARLYTTPVSDRLPASLLASMSTLSLVELGPPCSACLSALPDGSPRSGPKMQEALAQSDWTVQHSVPTAATGHAHQGSKATADTQEE
jgi:hypothetical protein